MTRSCRHCTGTIAQKLLHDAIFQTVKTDHHDPTTGQKHLFGCGKTFDQFVQFTVDVNTHRLETADRRILLRLGTLDVGAVTKCLAHDCGKLAGRGQRAGSNDGAGNPARLAFLAIAIEDVRYFPLVRFIQKVRRTRPLLRHAHV